MPAHADAAAVDKDRELSRAPGRERRLQVALQNPGWAKFNVPGAAAELSPASGMNTWLKYMPSAARVLGV